MAIAKKPAKKAVPAEKAVPVAGTTGTYKGYCVKCKAKDVEYQGSVVVSKTGMNMAQGPCPTCGTKVSRILGKAK